MRRRATPRIPTGKRGFLGVLGFFLGRRLSRGPQETGVRYPAQNSRLAKLTTDCGSIFHCS